MSEFTCWNCKQTFPINPAFDSAEEYAQRFGDAPRTDDVVCDDCYAKILVSEGHCADCLNKPCTCAEAAAARTEAWNAAMKFMKEIGE